MNCKIIRKKLITKGVLTPSGIVEYKDNKEWRVEECGIPLFSNDVEEVCSSCLKGWTHEHNYMLDTKENADLIKKAKIAIKEQQKQKQSRASRELTEKEIITFCALDSLTTADKLFDRLLDTDNSGLVLKEIEKQFEAINLKVDKKVMIAVLAISNGIAGKSIKFVNDISKIANKLNYSKINWDIFTNKVYPSGKGIPLL